MEQGVASGTIRPTDNPFGRAALLAIWQLGAVVLHKHMDRLLGVDLTDPDATTKPSLVNYVGPVYEVLGGGFFTDEFTEHLGEVLAALRADSPPDSSPSPEPSADGPSTTKGRS